MPPCILTSGRVPIQIWCPPETVDAQAMAQLKCAADLPWTFHHVAAMPDVHAGIGATIGCVLALEDAIAPAAVGVDIGCGMAALATSLRAGQLPDSLRELRLAIEAAIPTGFAQHDQILPWAARHPEVRALLAAFPALAPRVQALREKAMQQIGTLGGGNHFIEVCLDEGGQVWLLLHSGSRHIGKALAEAHIAAARKLPHNHGLPDPDLSVLLAGTPQMRAYCHDLDWAQHYARLNREAMLDILKHLLSARFPQVVFPEAVSCHHNYVAEETHFGRRVLVTRKGAIRARAGERGIVPGSMGSRSYLVRGLGNPESFESASHGAGRVLSRHQAARRFSEQDLRAQTEGVECRKDRRLLDEAPGAYRDIEVVMAQQRDLVEVEHVLKQVLCVKG